MPSKEKQIRNGRNMIIGWTQEYPDRIIAVHYKKGYVGCYSKGADVTTEVSGKIYCYGDGSTDLVRIADKEFIK